MLGNDVIDLQKAARDSQWRREGYLKKICTVAEQQLILNAAEPSVMLWLIWSMKEAAYKIENRITGRRFYAPKSFSCGDLGMAYSLIDDAVVDEIAIEKASIAGKIANDALAGFKLSSSVSYQNRIFQIRSFISNRLIHSIACLDTSIYKTTQIYYLKNTPFYQQDFNQMMTDYQLEKDKAGLPAVIHQKSGLKHTASISHHGQYLAIIFSDFLLLKD